VPHVTADEVRRWSQHAACSRIDLAGSMWRKKSRVILKAADAHASARYQLIGTSPRGQIDATLKLVQATNNKPSVAAVGRDAGMLAKISRFHQAVREIVTIWHAGPNYPNMRSLVLRRDEVPRGAARCFQITRPSTCAGAATKSAIRSCRQYGNTAMQERNNHDRE